LKRYSKKTLFNLIISQEISMRFVLIPVLLLLLFAEVDAQWFSFESKVFKSGTTISGYYMQTLPDVDPKVQSLVVVDSRGNDVNIPLTINRMIELHAPNFHTLKATFSGTIPADIPGQGDSLFRIKATNSATYGTMLSDPFHIVPKFFSGVTLLTPQDGATNVGRLPTLRWTSESPTLFWGGQMQLSTSPDFPKDTKQTYDTSSSFNITLTRQLMPNTTYYWRVRAWIGNGEYDAWSTTFSFTTIDNKVWEPVGSINDSAYSLATSPSGRLFLGSGHTVWASDNGGATWKLNSDVGMRRVWAVVPIGGDTIFASSESREEKGVMIHGTFINGQYWSNMIPSSASTKGYYPLSLTSTRTLLVGTTDGYVHGTRNYGLGEQAFSQLVASGRITALYGNDGRTMFAGVRESAGGNGSIYRTSDSGTTWMKSATGLPNDVHPMTIVRGPSGTIYMASSGADGGIYASTSNGDIWSRRTEGLSGTIRAMTVATDGEIFVATTENVYRSTNGGNAWRVMSASGAALNAPALAIIGDSTLFAATSSGKVHAISISATRSATTPDDSTTGVPTSVKLQWPEWNTADRYHVQVSSQPFSATSAKEGSSMQSAAIVAEDSTLTSAKYMLSELSPGTMYHWRVRAHLVDGWSNWSASNAFTTTTALSVGSQPSETRTLQSSVHPNPAQGTMMLRFTLPMPAPVRATVHDAHGSVVATLLDGPVESGDHFVTWQADGVSSGVYFYRIQAGAEFESGEIVKLPE
jgi:hypothetical protein